MAYDAAFFDYVDQGATRSADVVVRELMPHLRPHSLLDVGCGRGAWARAWQRAGCADILGIDGDHVDRATLFIGAAEFRAADLSGPFDLGRRFDLVQCLEVAEHLPARAAGGLIDSIARHGDVVLFSAAVPGQGGTHHINERPLEYWRGEFAQRGFQPFDALRPRISEDPAVEPWYRFNSLIYANAAGQARLPPAVRATAVDVGCPLREFGPWSWQLRQAVIRWLPTVAVDQLARVNAMVSRRRSGRA